MSTKASMTMTARGELEAARLTWRQAKLRFNLETNPDLIDAAIYDMKAAELRMAAAWRQIKAEAMAGRAISGRKGDEP